MNKVDKETPIDGAEELFADMKASCLNGTPLEIDAVDCDIVFWLINQTKMFEKQQQENEIYRQTLQEISVRDKMLYSQREMGNFARKALKLPAVPLKD